MTSVQTQQQKRIQFGRKNLDPATEIIFKQLANYFANLFYNFGYASGKKLFADKKVNTVTDGYRHFCAALLSSVQKKDFTGDGSYTHMLGSISEYCGKSTGLPVTRGKTIEDIFKCFVPSDMYEIIDIDAKRTFVRDMVLNLCTKIVNRIVNDNIVYIIDYHDNKETLLQLYNDIIDIFVAEREVTMAKFITGKKIDTTIDMGYYNLLRAEYEKEVQQRHELSRQLYESQQQNKTLKHESIRLIEICRETERKNKTLKEDNSRLENMLYDLRKIQRHSPRPMFSTTVQPENYMSQTQTNRNSSIANANAIGTNITPDINFINSHGDSFNNTDLNDDAFGDVEDDFIENNGNEIDRDKVNVNGVIAEDGAENEPAEQIIQPPPRSNEPSPEQNTLKSENTKENLEKTKLKEKNTEPPAEKIEVKEEKKKRGRKKKEPEIKNTTDVQLPLGTDMGPSKNIFDDF